MSIIPEGFIPVFDRKANGIILKKTELCTPRELMGGVEPEPTQDVFGTVTNAHTCVIRKGELGQLSKIQEELDEASDALEQGNKILFLVELADIYGALAAVAARSGITMEDLKIQADSKSKTFT